MLQQSDNDRKKQLGRWQHYMLARLKRLLDHLDSASDEEFNPRDIGEAITYKRQIKRYYMVLSPALKKDMEARICHLEKFAGLR